MFVAPHEDPKIASALAVQVVNHGFEIVSKLLDTATFEDVTDPIEAAVLLAAIRARVDQIREMAIVIGNYRPNSDPRL